MSHVEVAYCAQGGTVPAKPKAKEVLCPNPTVYYGANKNRTNCATCGHQEKKVTYLIPIKDHIQVSPHRSPQVHSSSCLAILLTRCACVSVPLCPVAVLYPGPVCCWQNLWGRNDLRDDLQRSFVDYNPNTEVKEQSDVIHSRAFREHCGEFVSGESYRNIVLMLYADGVSMTNRSEYSMFVISAQVVNLPPHKRRQLSNMLLLQLIPGPKTPTMLDSLLQPLVDELKSLYEVGMPITVGGEGGGEGEHLNIRVMMFAIVADARAHPKLTMMMQTPAIYPCHLCLLKVTTHAHSAACEAMRCHASI